MVKGKKASKLLLLLGEYFGFSLLCGFCSMLFFLWTAGVISNNYSLETGMSITADTEYLLTFTCVAAGIFIAIFVLILLLQKKFAYIIQIKNRVEEMEAGNLARRIPIEGEDEMTDLAVSINNLAEAMSYNLKQTEQMQQERFQTIATLSHDLRTPLTSVMSYLQFIRDGQYADEAQLKLFAERAYDKAGRIKEMSDSLFDSVTSDFSDDGALENMDGMSFFKEALAEAEGLLSDSGFKVTTEFPSETLDFRIAVDRGSISRLFDNIISNIEKYADCQYPVNFKLQVDTENAVLQQSNRILDKHRRKNVESHLIGLKSIESALRGMGGTLTVKSESDSFNLQITLPVC